MAVEAAVVYYAKLRDAEYLQDKIHERLSSICKRIYLMGKDLSEAEVAKLKEERDALRRDALQVDLDMSRKPDFSVMTEAERAAVAERLRSDTLLHAERLKDDDDTRARVEEAIARIVDFDPKQGGLYYSRFSPANLTRFDLDEESPIGPMRFIDSPRYRGIASDSLSLTRAVNFLSIKIASSDVGFPIRVYGTIIVRDSIDERCVYHFRRDSDHSQLINSEDESLILTGPKRGLALCDDIYVETDLKMKDPIVQDRELSKGIISIRDSSFGPLATGYKVVIKHLATRLSTVNVIYALMERALEATIAVEVLQGGFRGTITALTANREIMLVIYDSKEADAMTVDDRGVLKLVRHVVSVHVKDVLVITAETSDGKSECIAFDPKINARAQGTLVVGSAKLLVKLSWSVMNPY